MITCTHQSRKAALHYCFPAALESKHESIVEEAVSCTSFPCLVFVGLHVLAIETESTAIRSSVPSDEKRLSIPQQCCNDRCNRMFRLVSRFALKPVPQALCTTNTTVALNSKPQKWPKLQIGVITPKHKTKQAAVIIISTN